MSFNSPQYYPSNYHPEQKEPVIAWLMWFFLGIFGGHRFYLKQHKQGFGILALWVILVFVLSTSLAAAGYPTLGLICMLLVWIWWAVESIMLNSNIRKSNSQLSKPVFG